MKKPDWRYVALVELPDGFHVVTFMTHFGFNNADKKALGLEGEPTASLTAKTAEIQAGKFERALFKNDIRRKPAKGK